MNTFIWWYNNDETYLPYTDLLVIRALTLNAAREIVVQGRDDRAIELSLDRPGMVISASDSYFFERAYRGT